MGNQAAKQIKQFPKAAPPSPSGTSTGRTFVGEKGFENSHAENPQPEKQTIVGVELTEEEIKMEQKQEQEMREYLNTLQGLAGSVHQQQAEQSQNIFPEGVKFVRNYKEEKELQKQIDEDQKQDDKKYLNRLGKEKLDELFRLHRQDPDTWTYAALAVKYSQNPEKIQQTLENFSPVLQNIKGTEESQKLHKNKQQRV